MEFLLSPLSASASALLSQSPSFASSSSHSSASSASASAHCLSYDAGQPLNCFSFSTSLQQLAIGGKDVRLLSLSTSAIAHVAAFPSSAAASHVTSLAFHASSPSLLASLSTCQILLYATSGSQRRLVTVWEEHTRTVNRVLWGGGGGGAGGDDSSAFWSCSQDGQVKRWDARQQDSVAAFIDEIVVRDIAINPFNPLQVAAAYDNGSVCIWDARRATSGGNGSSASAPSDRVLSIAAHRDLIGTLDWHPSIPHRLASGSQDKCIHVWNTAATAAAAAPLFSITTTSPLGRIAWRPGREHQLASCTTLLDSDVHVWNLQTPFIPLATCRHHRAAVTGLQWREEGDELLSCSKDGTVQQVPLTAAFAPYAHLSTVAVDWSVRGEVASVEDVMQRQAVIAMRNPPALFPMQFQYAAAAAAARQSGSSGSTAAVVQPGLVHIHEVLKEMHSSRRGTGSRQRQEGAEEEQETAERQHNAGQWKSEVEVLVHCARHYRLRDGGVLSCCRHNAQVALDCGRPQLAHIWELTALLFADDDNAAAKTGQQPLKGHTAAVSPMPSPSAAAAPPSSSSPFTFAAAASSTRDFLAYRVQSPAAASHHPPASASHASAASLPGVLHSSSPTAARLYHPALQPSASYSASQLSRVDVLLESLPVVHASHCLRGEGGAAAAGLLQRRRYRSQLLSSLLTQLVDSGDVQTVCCLLTALSPAGGLEGLAPETLRRWYAAYVEQLTRLQLFSSAAETMRACDDVLQLQRSAKTSQQLSLMCARCRRGGEFGDRGPYCAHCRQSMSDCALCQLPVRGVFAWCQGCGHGGHAEHMQLWFSQFALCPTGCLHRCVDSLTAYEPD